MPWMEGGAYKDSVRLCYYSLIDKKVPTNQIEAVVAESGCEPPRERPDLAAPLATCATLHIHVNLYAYET